LFGEVFGAVPGGGVGERWRGAVDGTKVHANASNMVNVDYRQPADQILAEAARIDAEQAALYGEARGDELPEQLRTAEGRRNALKEAKERLKRQRAPEANFEGLDLVSCRADAREKAPARRGCCLLSSSGLCRVDVGRFEGCLACCGFINFLGGFRRVSVYRRRVRPGGQRVGSG
jgi:hypothetical protein